MMTNVLVEGLSAIPSVVLTNRDFARYSDQLSFNLRCKLSRNITHADMSWCDVMVCIRGNNPLSAYLAVKAKSLGKKVILTIDDDLLAYTGNSHSYIEKLAKDSLIRVIENADIISTTSLYLGEKYKRQFGVNYVLLDTIVEQSEFDEAKTKDPDKVKIVYAAGAGHVLFFDKLIKPIIGDLTKRYRDSISFTFIGPNPQMDDMCSPAEYIPSMPFDKYQQFMKENHFDIGLAPLTDSELCRSKYFNKFIEYTKHGICGLYSDVIPYNLIIRNNFNGLLVGELPTDWFNKLCYLIDNAQNRVAMVQNAKNQLIEEFSLEAICSRIKRDIPFLYTFKSKKCKPFLFRHMYLYFLLCEIRKRFLDKIRNI